MKLCRKCETEKEIKDFRILKNGKNRTICINCDREYARERYRKNRKSELKKNKDYRESNKETLKLKRRKRTGSIERRIGRDPLKYKETVRRRTKNYREKHPEKIKAHGKVRAALKINELSKPVECEICKKKKILEAHHEDYSRPLEVIWICRQCHIKLHRKKLDEYLDPCRNSAKSTSGDR